MPCMRGGKKETCLEPAEAAAALPSAAARDWINEVKLPQARNWRSAGPRLHTEDQLSSCEQPHGSPEPQKSRQVTAVDYLGNNAAPEHALLMVLQTQILDSSPPFFYFYFFPPPSIFSLLNV